MILNLYNENHGKNKQTENFNKIIIKIYEITRKKFKIEEKIIIFI